MTLLERSAVAYAASRYALAWALLAWIAVIAGGLSLRDSLYDGIAEISYQMATGIGLMALLWFGLLNILHGIAQDFSVGQIVLTTFAIGIGGYGGYVTFSVLPALAFAGSVGLCILGEAAITVWLVRKQERIVRQAAARPVIEPTLRGSGSVLETGPDGVRFIPRNETGRNTPAERFEQRLIRYIERALEIEAISMAGTNASYWRFRLPDQSHVVELSVIGPGYNTTARIRDSERWQLRIREPKPCNFTVWIAQHFGVPDCGVRRNLGAVKQTMFASSLLESDNDFFDKGIPWPEETPPLGHGGGQWTMHVLRLHALEEADAENEEDENTLEHAQRKKPTLH